MEYNPIFIKGEKWVSIGHASNDRYLVFSDDKVNIYITSVEDPTLLYLTDKKDKIVGTLLVIGSARSFDASYKNYAYLPDIKIEDNKYKGKGYGKKLYEIMAYFLKKAGKKGIVSEIRSRSNKVEIPKIYANYNTRKETNSKGIEAEIIEFDNKTMDLTPEQAAKQFIDSLSSEQIEEIKSSYKEIVGSMLKTEEDKLIELESSQKAMIDEKNRLYEEEKTLPADKKGANFVKRNKLHFDAEKLSKPILLQKNRVIALRNGGDLANIEDKKGETHNHVPNFTSVDTTQISFDEETILTDSPPVYIPVINEATFKAKGYVFDAIRTGNDQYLLAVNGYTAESLRHKEEYKDTDGFVLVTLDQLALISDFYTTKAKAKLQKDANDSNERQEKYWDSMDPARKKGFLEQKGLYHSLPVKIKKTITQEAYTALSWEEKEKIYKFFKRSGIKRMVSKLDDTHMWSSYHKMYERFLNPQAVNPKPGIANNEVFAYWVNFRDMMSWKIKDIQVLRESDSEIRKIALETSFGDSNINDSLKGELGIFVKRQDGSNINIVQIDQIAKAWKSVENIFGTLSFRADGDNLKISHTGNTFVYASKAVGMFIPKMNAIAVSNKFGSDEFDSTLAHELAHWIDYKLGAELKKRYLSGNYESTAGQIALTVKKNLNKKSQSDYINSSIECFARGMEQYYSIETRGEDARLSYSYTNLQGNIPYFIQDNYVSKSVYDEKLKPLIEQFLSENKDFFKEFIPDLSSKEMKNKFLVNHDEIINAMTDLASKSTSDVDFVKKVISGFAENFGVSIMSQEFQDAMGMVKGDTEGNKKKLKNFYLSQGMSRKREIKSAQKEAETNFHTDKIIDMAEKAGKEMEDKINKSNSIESPFLPHPKYTDKRIFNFPVLKNIPELKKAFSDPNNKLEGIKENKSLYIVNSGKEFNQGLFPASLNYSTAIKKLDSDKFSSYNSNKLTIDDMGSSFKIGEYFELLGHYGVSSRIDSYIQKWKDSIAPFPVGTKVKIDLSIDKVGNLSDGVFTGITGYGEPEDKAQFVVEHTKSSTLTTVKLKDIDTWVKKGYLVVENTKQMPKKSNPITIKGFHGNTGKKSPSDALYLGDFELASNYGEDTKDVKEYEVTFSNPFIVKSDSDFDPVLDIIVKFQEENPLAKWHPNTTEYVNQELKKLGYDGLILEKEAFETEKGYADIGGTYGDPQIIVFNKENAREIKAEKMEEKINSSTVKIPLKELTIHWAEGDQSGYDKFPKTYDSWVSANKAVLPIYSDSVKDNLGGYNKVKFSVIFNDGETYEGRLDVSEKEDNPTSGNVFGKHIKDFLSYELSEKSRSSEQSKKEIREFLDKYDLGLDGDISKIEDSGEIKPNPSYKFQNSIKKFFDEASDRHKEYVKMILKGDFKGARLLAEEKGGVASNVRFMESLSKNMGLFIGNQTMSEYYNSRPFYEFEEALVDKIKEMFVLGDFLPKEGLIKKEDITENSRFKLKNGTVFIVDRIDIDTTGMIISSSIEGGAKGNYRDEINDAVAFLNEEGAIKIEDSLVQVYESYSDCLTRNGINLEKDSHRFEVGTVVKDNEVSFRVKEFTEEKIILERIFSIKPVSKSEFSNADYFIEYTLLIEKFTKGEVTVEGFTVDEKMEFARVLNTIQHCIKMDKLYNENEKLKAENKKLAESNKNKYVSIDSMIEFVLSKTENKGLLKSGNYSNSDAGVVAYIKDQQKENPGVLSLYGVGANDIVKYIYNTYAEDKIDYEEKYGIEFTRKVQAVISRIMNEGIGPQLKNINSDKFPLGWGDSIIVTPEKTKLAKEWWSSLSINEQKSFIKKHLPENWPSDLVYTKDGKQLILMWEKENPIISEIEKADLSGLSDKKLDFNLDMVQKQIEIASKSKNTKALEKLQAMEKGIIAERMKRLDQEETNIPETISGLKTLLSLTTDKKEKLEIKETIQALKLLL